MGYSLYGLIDCLKQYRKKNKINSELEHVPEYIKEIVSCHIVKRNPKLRKSVENRVKNDIIKGNYEMKICRLTEKLSVPDDEPDGSPDYYLTFDNDKKYRVLSIVYDHAKVGDTLYTIVTPTDVIQVIRSQTEYFNMFIY